MQLSRSSPSFYRRVVWSAGIWVSPYAAWSTCRSRRRVLLKGRTWLRFTRVHPPRNRSWRLDVIVGFAGDHVGSAEELTSFVTATEPGTTVNVTVLRGGEEKTFEVLVGSLPREYE